MSAAASAADFVSLPRKCHSHDLMSITFIEASVSNVSARI
jgi:hypothetical protein